MGEAAGGLACANHRDCQRWHLRGDVQSRYQACARWQVSVHTGGAADTCANSCASANHGTHTAPNLDTVGGEGCCGLSGQPLLSTAADQKWTALVVLLVRSRSRWYISPVRLGF